MICYTNKHKIPFQIDEEDHEIVSNYSWCMQGGYVSKSIKKDGYSSTIHLHIFLLGYASFGKVWDHKDRNIFNNQRDNLKQVDLLESNRNRSVQKGSLSGVRGVYVNLGRGRLYRVAIMVDHILIGLGSYDTLEEAAKVRLNAELKYWGFNPG